MRIKIYFAALILLTIFFGLFPIKPAFADTYTISGTIKSSSGNAISGATITVNDSNNDSTISDSSGNYSLPVPQGTYNITVTPPSGSDYSPASSSNRTISSNTVINFVFASAGTVELYGHIYDQNGNPLANQTVYLVQSSSDNTHVGQVTTGSDGSYSTQVLPGTYFDLVISGSTNSNSSYELDNFNYGLNQNTTLDITVPIQQVNANVQGSSENNIPNTIITTSPQGGSPWVNTNLVINGVTYLAKSTSTGTTDSNGNTSLSLFPGDYTLTATPPSGSNYAATTLNTTISTSTTQIPIQLQQPVTLSGHIYDQNGNPLANQTVYLVQSSSDNTHVGQVTTGSDGSYSTQVLPGTYFDLVISGSTNSTATYELDDFNYSLTQNMILDITVPIQQVNVNVQDASGDNVSNVAITTSPQGGSPWVNTNLVINGVTYLARSSSTGTTDSNGNTSLSLFPGDYTLTATPPSGSNYAATTLNTTISTSTTQIPIQLQQPVTLSGHIYDQNGNPLSGQHVYFIGSSSDNTHIGEVVTGSDGSYSTQVSSGDYFQLVFSGNTNSVSNYAIYTYNYTISQNTTLDLTLPIKQVTINVDDIKGNGIQGVSLSSSYVNGSPWANTNLALSGLTFLVQSASSGITDSNGSSALSLFPGSYTFVATPPNGSIYSQFNLNNISVTGNENEVISLQYNHATPATIATLSPSSFSDGLYADPTTVTLSASAASGYSVANTYYTIDGGSQQTYSSPFIVTGAGNHTITYWSVDNSGVIEATNTKTFTITEAYSLSGAVYNDANQNGFQDPGEQGVAGATVTLNTGQSTTTDSNGNYTFSNLESGTYTETLTVPTGYSATTTNPVSVPLSANTTENFGIAQLAPTPVVAINAGGSTFGDFSSDTDYNGGATYTTSSSIDTSGVTNPAPTAVYQSVRYGNFSYTIPNLTANGTYTLQLHFSEPYWGTSQAGGGGVGSRIFNVSVNGTQALTDFDVYQAAGGANKAVMEQILATADSNGNITITFSNVVDNAMVSGIAVYNGTLPSLTPSPTPTPVSSLAISAGGQGSGSYIADTDYTGGTTYNTTASIDTTGVTDPAPVAVYQNVRYGNTFSYTIPTYSPNTNYTVRLDFSEPYWNSAGSREFNVSINGTQVLNNFDVYQTAGGENKAVAETFNTTSDSNGFIKIQFTTVTDNAMVSGIQISQQ